MSRYAVGSENLTAVEKPQLPNTLNLNRINRKNFVELPEKKTEETEEPKENGNVCLKLRFLKLKLLIN